MLVGAIEAGGTKFIVAIANENGEVVEQITIPTRTPNETMKEVRSLFERYEIKRIGIGSFGPINVNPESEKFGELLSTPKIEWVGFNIVSYLKRYFNIPIKVDTDVNVAALAEVRYGAAKDVSSCVYLTIGTGIGGGAYLDGKLIHGIGHPEMGHINVKRHPQDGFEGICPYHKDCFEGLASGPAIEARFNQSAKDLPDDHIAWEIESHYIAEALINYILILAPERIVLGGGVSKKTHLIPLVRKKVKERLNGYIQSDKLEKIDEYIVYTGLNDLAGLYGAIALALEE